MKKVSNSKDHQKGLGLIGVLLILGALVITTGGMLIWEKKATPTPPPAFPTRPYQKSPPSQGQIYQNAHYGFKFTFPEGWKPSEFEVSTLAFEPGYSAVALWPEKNFPNSAGDGPLTIKIYIQPNDERGNPVLLKDFFKVPNDRASQTTVAGEIAWRFIDNRPGFSSYGAYHDIVVFDHNRYLFMIAGSVKVSAEYDPSFISGTGIMSQILGSFEFVK